SLCRAELASGREPLERASRPEDASDEIGAARVGDEADVDERGDEARRVGRDTDVARAGDGDARAGGDAVDRGDHRLLERANRKDVRVVVVAQAGGDVPGGLAELRQVLSHAEPAPGPGQDDGANVRISGLLEGAGEGPVHLSGEGVEDVRAVERNRQDLALATRLDHGHDSADSRRSLTRGCEVRAAS